MSQTVIHYIKDQLYHFNVPAFILICGFVILLGKMNMKKEVQKIHCDVRDEIMKLKTIIIKGTNWK